MKRIIQLAALGAICLPVMLPLDMSAQAAGADRSDRINAIIRDLDVEESQSGMARAYRGAKSVTITIGRKTKVIMVDYSHSIDMTVFFKYNSAVLTAQGKAELDSLGAALESEELKPQRFLLSGHTDSRGSRSYNRHLSFRRAAAVRDYLVNNWSVDPYRLDVYGWGERRLKDPRHPTAAINRRVEVSVVVPSMTQQQGNAAPNNTTISVDGKKVMDTDSDQVTVKVKVLPGATTGNGATGPATDCANNGRSDPRPATAPIDDFGGRRTPLPCENSGNTSPDAQDRIKLNN